MNTVRLVKNTRQATRADLETTLEYFQGGLALSRFLEHKLESMPLVIRALLEERGIDFTVGEQLTAIFTTGCHDVLELMELI